MRTVTRLAIACAVACLAHGCRPATEAPASGTQGSESTQAKQADLLVFPNDLRVADEAVNRFVTRAMTACSTGDYEKFRLLWSARESPLPREEFEEGWHAVQRIKVRVLQEVKLEADPAVGREAPQTAYALLVDVSLDPTLKAGQKEPVRHVVLMLVLENDEWRLAKAPKAMREWVKNKVPPEPAGDKDLTLTQPPAPTPP